MALGALCASGQRTGGVSRSRCSAVLVVALSILAGCATAEPILAGGRTTPRDRSDLGLGGAVRVPIGDLAPDQTGAPSDASSLMTFGAPSGAAPVAFVRHGVTNDVELGAEVIGSSLRGTVRGQIRLGSLAHLMIGAAPTVGLIYDGSGGTAVRGGGTVPIAITVDAFGLYELWVGARVGLEHVAGDVSGRSVDLSGLRTGGVIGLGVGFRVLHLLVELAVDHELWWGSLGDSSIVRNGISLTPAFALRFLL